MMQAAIAPRTREGSDGLIEAARSGDLSAYAQLVLRCEQPAFRLAYLLLRDPNAAAELATRSLVRRYAALDETHDALAFLTGLLRGLVEAAPKSSRSAGRRSQQAATRPPDVAAVWGEQNRALLGALGCLAPKEQSILYLRYFLGLDLPEAAAILGYSEAQTRTRLDRAIARLAAALRRSARRDTQAAAAEPNLERALQVTAASFPFPPAAALAEAVRERLDQPAARPESPIEQGERLTDGSAASNVTARLWPIVAGLAASVIALVVLALLFLR